MMPWKTESVSICEASPRGAGKRGRLWRRQKMLSNSGLDRDARHRVGLCAPENYTSSSLLSSEITVCSVPGSRDAE